jgi:hypothetical protein
MYGRQERKQNEKAVCRERLECSGAIMNVNKDKNTLSNASEPVTLAVSSLGQSEDQK